ncbi:MAG: hypothetical protein KKH01_03770 [Firmicutes bacterium]|nr:hypothetical protein [Bacillota bacterium]
MKKSEIVKLFKLNIESHLPTSIPKMDWIVLGSDQNTISTYRKPSQFIFSFKMILTTVFIVAAIVFGIGLFNKTPIQTVLNPYANVAYQDTLSVSAVSTATIMGNYTATTLSYNQSLSLIKELSTNDTVTTIEPYLGMIETITGQNLGITTTNLESDNPLYESKVILSTIDLLGSQITYTLYFNTVTYTEDEGETQFEIDGIFLYKNFQFDFIGKKEIEGDQEVITFKTTNGGSNYVESIYKTEDNESKYSIKIVENNIVVSESKIKVDEEDGNRVIDFEYINGSDSGSYQFNYEQEDGINLLKIEYHTIINGIEESGQMKVEIKTDLLTGLTSYQIFVLPDDGDEYEYESERHVDNDDEDEEDEEDEQDQEEDEEDSQDE